MTAKRPDNVMNLSEQELHERVMHIYGYRAAPLAEPLGAEKLGFHLGEIQPGCFICPYHLHHEEEELVLVLSGSATVRQDDQKYVVKENDLVFFKRNSSHQMYNHTDQPCRILALSNKDPHDVCEYPDSGKIYFRKFGKILKDGKETDYMDGEQERAPFWD